VFQFFSGGRQPVFPDVGGEVPTLISPVDNLINICTLVTYSKVGRERHMI
jgi:hypothetical protein